MQSFVPHINLVAVDLDSVLVSFDSAAEHDSQRSPSVVRIARPFAELRVVVEGFDNAPGTVLLDRKEYRGVIKLLVRPLEGDAAALVLAEPNLWIESDGKAKSGEHTFPTEEAVKTAVRQGVSFALSRALGAFFAKEAHLDATLRAPAAVTPNASTGRLVATEMIGGAIPPSAAEFAAPDAANDPVKSGRAKEARHRRNLVLALVGTPVAAIALTLAGVAVAKRMDPVRQAATRAMAQDPSAVQAQVEITKRTLKEMGLDPGKAGDTGCLAPQ